MFKLAIICCLLAILAANSSCYRMPDQDEYSLIPATNNPDYTRESKKGNPMPGVGY